MVRRKPGSLVRGCVAAGRRMACSHNVGHVWRLSRVDRLPRQQPQPAHGRRHAHEPLLCWRRQRSDRHYAGWLYDRQRRRSAEPRLWRSDVGRQHLEHAQARQRRIHAGNDLVARHIRRICHRVSYERRQDLSVGQQHRRSGSCAQQCACR